MTLFHMHPLTSRIVRQIWLLCAVLTGLICCFHAAQAQTPSKEYIRLGGRVIALENAVAETVSTPTAPSGPVSGAPNTSYTYSTGGSTSGLGHSVQYQFNWGDGTNSGWLAVGTPTASHSWSSAGSYTVTAQARCSTDTAIVSAVSLSLTAGIATIETISTPTKPSGPTSGSPNTSYSYSTGGATSNLGHSVQYRFHWGDTTDSGWLAVGITSASHSWSSAGSYTVTAEARCATDTTIVSLSSPGLTVNIGEVVSAPTKPSGPASGKPGTSYSYSTGGSTSNLGHSVQYLFNWGDGSNSGWLAVGITSASHSWTTANSYTVTAQARCATDTTIVSPLSPSLTVNIETISTPTKPSGPTSGSTGISYSYSTGGATSNLGHSVQYQFNWGDGTYSGWLAVGTTSASHSWTTANSYTVTAQARCSTDTAIVSSVSSGLTVTITGETIVAPTTPTGVVWAQTGWTLTYTTGGASSNLGHSVQYLFNWGDGPNSNSGWLAVGTKSASHTYNTAGSYTVTAQAHCSTHTTVTSSLSSPGLLLTVVPPEAITPPTKPSGLVSGSTNISYTYSTGGSTSNWSGHTVEYQFTWGDGTTSIWLPVNTLSAEHTYSTAGSYTITAQARCSTNHVVISSFSSGLVVTITGPPSTAKISGKITSGGVNFSGITVNLTGSANKSTTTDTNGNYSFSGLSASGTYTVTPTYSRTTFSPSSWTSPSPIGSDKTANFTASVSPAAQLAPYSGTGTIYNQGDSYTLTVTGGPHLTVTCDYTFTDLNDNLTSGTWTKGSTDLNGVFSETGSFTESDAGRWSWKFYVNGVAAASTPSPLRFQVNP
jgi:predicted NAD-dependent protein-ADP-ribosyltransferase YbiA (DUF1768 family)